MKNYLLLLLALVSFGAYSQNPTKNAGGFATISGTDTMAPSAIMEARSTTKGVLVSRMTTTQRNAISSPATSLLIYNTTTSRFEYYNGSSWIPLTYGAVSSVTGTTVDNTDPQNPIVNVPTLDKVLTAGNTSLLDAKINNLYLYDNEGAAYEWKLYSNITDSEFTIENTVFQGKLKLGTNGNEFKLQDTGNNSSLNFSHIATNKNVTIDYGGNIPTGTYPAIISVAGQQADVLTGDVDLSGAGLGDASGDGITITSGTIDVMNLEAASLLSANQGIFNNANDSGSARVVVSAKGGDDKSGVYFGAFSDVGMEYDVSADNFSFAKNKLAVNGTTGAAAIAGAVTATNIDATNKTDIAARALDSGVVHNTGAETVAGVKTFSSAPVTSAINGGTAANDDIAIQGTTNATRTTSYVNLQPNGGSVGIGTSTPAALLDIRNSTAASAWVIGGTGSSAYAQMVFGEGVTGGTYTEFLRDANASTGAGRFIIANLNKSILLSTNFSGTYRQDLTIGSNGRIGIGVAAASSTARLHIAAGTATAETAPLKFTAGTNLTTTEAGAIEYNGTNLFYTASNGGTRYQLDRQVLAGSVSQVGTATTTFTVTIGSTMANSTYKVNVTPTTALAIGGYVTNKTTTTFDYILPVTTGTVTLDYIIAP